MKALFISCCLALTISSLRAGVILSISPVSQAAAVGQDVFVNVVVDGLVPGTSNVGAFDLHLDFDPSILTPLNVTFGPSLGDPSLFQAFASSTLLAAEVQFAEASLQNPATLAAKQGSRLTLATIEFGVTGLGRSSLTFSQTVIDDPFGGKLGVLAADASITGVPEPASLGLMLFSALILASAAGRQKSKARNGNQPS